MLATARPNLIQSLKSLVFIELMICLHLPQNWSSRSAADVRWHLGHLRTAELIEPIER